MVQLRPDPKNASFQLYLFGSPRLQSIGGTIELETRKALALLAYLAVTNVTQSREHLASLFWPEQAEPSARAGLRHALYVVRRALDDSIVVSDRQSVRLDTARLWIDVDVFEAATADIESLSTQAKDAPLDRAAVATLQQAVALYQAGFLSGFTLPDCPDFDRWQLHRTEWLGRRQALLLATLMNFCAARQNWEPAIDYAQQRLALDNLDEGAHRALIQLYAQAGERAAALRQYDEFVRLLRGELDADPDSETTALADAIRRGKYPGTNLPRLATDPMVGTAPPAICHNLPPTATAFVGREAEVGELLRQLASPDVRLVTVVGPGGMGKTRLALATADSVLRSSSYAVADGIWFISLAALSSVEYVVTAIGTALGLSFPGGIEPKRYLLEQMHARQMLLILDNFEHLMPDADLIVEIVAAAPNVKVLVTSRERLNLLEEWVLDLDGLGYPTCQAGEEERIEKWQTLEEQYAAVRLFANSARQARADFAVNQANASAIIRICHLTRGMPLALELAAGWIRTMPVQEIANEIDRGMELSTRLRNIPERHRSMRVVFEHSWRLLSPIERDIYARLSVFCCEVARPAAMAVTGATLPILASLVDKSLLHREREDRYVIHELLRQFAQEALTQDATQQKETERAFADFFATFLQEREAALSGPHQQAALEEIEVELDHVRLMWHWAVTNHDLDVLHRALHCWWKFSDERGYAQEVYLAFGRAIAAISEQLCDEIQHGCSLSQPAAAHPTDAEFCKLVLGRLLVRQGWLAERTYRPATQSAALMQRGLALLRALPGDHQEEIVQFLNYAHIIHYFLGNGDEADQLIYEAIRMANGRGDRWLWAIANYTLAQTREFQGNYPEARRLFDLVLPIFQAVGDETYVAYTLNNHYGRAALAIGDYPAARRGISEALAIRRRAQNPFAIGYSLLDLGRLALYEGDYVEARRCMEESLAIAEKHGIADSIARVCNGLGHVARLMGDLDQAAAYHRRSLAVYREVAALAHQPVALNGLGAVAVARAEWSEAIANFQESLQISQATCHIGQQAEAELGLARCQRAAGDRTLARAHLQQALAIAQQIEAAPFALESILVQVALMQDSAPVKAQQLLQLVSRHPATRYDTRQSALKQLDATVDDTASDLGGLDLWTIVAEIGAEQRSAA